MTLAQKLKQLEAQLKAAGYRIFDEDTASEPTINISEIPKKKSKKNDYEDDEPEYQLDVQMQRNDSAYCCGLDELGSFTVRDEGVGTTPEKVRVLAVAILLLKLKQNENKGTRRRNNLSIPLERQLMFTSNSAHDCSYIDDAMELIPDFWRAVARSVNPNGGNTLTTYMTCFLPSKK